MKRVGCVSIPMERMIRYSTLLQLSIQRLILLHSYRFDDYLSNPRTKELRCMIILFEPQDVNNSNRSL